MCSFVGSFNCTCIQNIMDESSVEGKELFERLFSSHVQVIRDRTISDVL